MGQPCHFVVRAGVGREKFAVREKNTNIEHSTSNFERREEGVKRVQGVQGAKGGRDAARQAILKGHWRHYTRLLRFARNDQGRMISIKYDRSLAF